MFLVNENQPMLCTGHADVKAAQAAVGCLGADIFNAGSDGVV